MRIIDTHTHLAGTLLGAKPKPIEQVRAEFEEGGLWKAWIFTTDGFLRDAPHNNTILAEAVSKHLDFFIPFCTVSPHDGAEAAVRELERASIELGMRGVKLHPWLQSFSLTNPTIHPILVRAGELGLPVIFHDGSPPYSTPLQVAAAAERVPGTTIILGHSGLDDLTEDAILACLRHENIYLGLCGPSCGLIEQIVRRCPVERLLFGSDGGFVAHAVEWALMRVVEAVPEPEVQQRIFLENPSRILAGRATT